MLLKNSVVTFLALLAITISTPVFAVDGVSQHLQDVSVTIRSPGAFGRTSEGSGVIFTREMEFNGEKQSVNFVWTAAHVVDNLRTIRNVVDPVSGTSRKVIEFRDAEVVKELVQEGRRVGELKMMAQVIRYSDAETGHDLALLRIRKRNFVHVGVRFYLEKDSDGHHKIPAIGTHLLHVGSLLGQFGSNSMTDGIMSQHGRLFGGVGGGAGVIFDQTTVNAFPGSSGGGVFLEDGRYVGMLVRGAGETFNFIVPVRRLHKWAKDAGVEWAVDHTLEMPSVVELHKLPVEDTGVHFKTDKNRTDKQPHGLKFMIREAPVPQVK